MARGLRVIAHGGLVGLAGLGGCQPDAVRGLGNFAAIAKRFERECPNDLPPALHDTRLEVGVWREATYTRLHCRRMLSDPSREGVGRYVKVTYAKAAPVVYDRREMSVHSVQVAYGGVGAAPTPAICDAAIDEAVAYLRDLTGVSRAQALAVATVMRSNPHRTPRIRFTGGRFCAWAAGCTATIGICDRVDNKATLIDIDLADVTAPVAELPPEHLP